MADSTLTKSPARLRFGFNSGSKRNIRRPGSVLGIEFGARTVRAAQVTQRGANFTVTKVASLPVVSEGEVDLSDASAAGSVLNTALTRGQLRGSPVVLGVPRQMVVLRTLQLPAVEDIRELASIVHLQIAKELPFRPEDAVIDFKVRAPADRALPAVAAPDLAAKAETVSDPNAAVAKVDVLVAAVRRETVQHYQALAAAAKVKLVGLGWLSEANARAASACGWLKDADPVALITLRLEEIGVDIIAGGFLVFSRGTTFKVETAPADAGVEAPVASAEAITIEVARSLHSYAGLEGNPPVAKLIIVGGTGQEEMLRSALQERFQIPCSVVDPVPALELDAASSKEASEALGAVGLGLGINDSQGLPFDFLHPKRPAVQRNMRRIWTLVGCTVAVVLLMGFFGLRARLLNQRLKIYRDLQTELAKSEKQVPIFRRMQQQAATIQTWNKEGRNWLEQFAYLSAVLPGSEDLYITAFNVSAQGNIHLSVQARSGEILAKLDRQLRDAGYDVKPLAITPASEKHGYNFRSTVELIVPAKMKIDLSKVQPPSRPADDGSLDTEPRKGGGHS